MRGRIHHRRETQGKKKTEIWKINRKLLNISKSKVTQVGGLEGGSRGRSFIVGYSPLERTQRQFANCYPFQLVNKGVNHKTRRNPESLSKGKKNLKDLEDPGGGGGL